MWFRQRKSGMGKTRSNKQRTVIIAWIALGLAGCGGEMTEDEMLADSFDAIENASTGLEFSDNFESGAPKSTWSQRAVCNSQSIRVVSNEIPAGQGSKYMRTQRTHNESGSTAFCRVRAELWKRNVDSARTFGETWVGVQIYVPGSWNTASNWNRVLQFHGNRDSGEQPRNPAFALVAERNRWKVSVAFDRRRTTPPGERNGGYRNFTTSMTKNKWTNWVFHWLWSYGDDGLLEAWKDGVKVVTYRGPNCFNDVRGPATWQMGNYQRESATPIGSPLIVYHDNLRIGNHNSSFARVNPAGNGGGGGGGTPPPPPPPGGGGGSADGKNAYREGESASVRGPWQNVSARGASSGRVLRVRPGTRRNDNAGAANSSSVGTLSYTFSNGQLSANRTQHFWIRYKAAGFGSDSVYVARQGGAFTRKTLRVGSGYQWFKTGVTAQSNRNGSATFLLKNREAGLEIDRVFASDNRNARP